MSSTNSSSAATTGGTDGLHGISATSVVASDLEIDSGTLSVDATNNRIGLGDTAPGTQLQIKSTAPYVTIQNSTSENTDGGCEGKVIFEDHADVSLAQIEGSHSGSSDDTKGQLILSTHTGSALTAGLTIDEAQKSTFAGNVGIGGASSADLSIESSGTADSVIRINHNNAAGDPFVKLTTNAVNWSVGLDNSDADKFMIASGGTPSTNPRLTVDTSGNVGLGTVTPNAKLTVEGTIKLKEQDDADADTGDYGQIWVNTASPNELYFTTDAGDDIQLTSGTAAAFVGDITGVTAGVGLSGGGTSGAVTLALDLSELSAVTPADGDSFSTLDSDGAVEQRTTTTALATLLAGTGLTASSSVIGVDAAQTQITSVGTIGTGTWQGTAVASAYLDADTAHLSGTQTFSGTKTLNSFKGTGATTVTNILDEDAMGTNSATALATQQSIKAYADTKSPVAGHSSIATVGTIGTGTWQGTAIANSYVAALPTSKITSGTMADARIAASNVTQHQGSITGTGTISSGAWEATDIAVAHGGTGASSLTDGGVLLGSGTAAITATAVLGDGEMLVGDASGDPSVESGATLRTSIGVGTGDSPTFTDLTLSGGDIAFGNAQVATVGIAAVTGTNTAGRNLTIAAGQGTGSGVGGNLVFQTADGGGSGSGANSLVTALTITDNLVAAFAGDIKVGGNNIVDNGGAAGISFDGSGNTQIDLDCTIAGGDVQYANGQNATLSVATTGAGTDGRDLTLTAGSAPTGSANQNGGDLILASGGGDGNGTSMMSFNTKVSQTDPVIERMRIDTAGNLGIHTTAPEGSVSIGSGCHIIAADIDIRTVDDGNGRVVDIVFGFKIPAFAIITEVVAVVKAQSDLSTHLVSIFMADDPDLTPDAALPENAATVELLGAGVTNTDSSDSASAEDIDMRNDTKEVWICRDTVRVGTDSYLYICNAGTGNGTTDPTSGTLTVIVKYYGMD